MQPTTRLSPRISQNAWQELYLPRYTMIDVAVINGADHLDFLCKALKLSAADTQTVLEKDSDYLRRAQEDCRLASQLLLYVLNEPMLCHPDCKVDEKDFYLRAALVVRSVLLLELDEPLRKILKGYYLNALFAAVVKDNPDDVELAYAYGLVLEAQVTAFLDNSREDGLLLTSGCQGHASLLYLRKDGLNMVDVFLFDGFNDFHVFGKEHEPGYCDTSIPLARFEGHELQSNIIDILCKGHATIDKVEYMHRVSCIINSPFFERCRFGDTSLSSVAQKNENCTVIGLLRFLYFIEESHEKREYSAFVMKFEDALYAKAQTDTSSLKTLAIVKKRLKDAAVGPESQRIVRIPLFDRHHTEATYVDLDRLNSEPLMFFGNDYEGQRMADSFCLECLEDKYIGLHSTTVSVPEPFVLMDYETYILCTNVQIDYRTALKSPYVIQGALFRRLLPTTANAGFSDAFRVTCARYDLANEGKCDIEKGLYDKALLCGQSSKPQEQSFFLEALSSYLCRVYCGNIQQLRSQFITHVNPKRICVCIPYEREIIFFSGDDSRVFCVAAMPLWHSEERKVGDYWVLYLENINRALFLENIFKAHDDVWPDFFRMHAKPFPAIQLPEDDMAEIAYALASRETQFFNFDT